jgi:hypothetical protein
VLARLIPRFPTMQLVKPVEQLRAPDLLTGGLDQLWLT